MFSFKGNLLLLGHDLSDYVSFIIFQGQNTALVGAPRVVFAFVSPRTLTIINEDLIIILSEI